MFQHPPRMAHWYLKRPCVSHVGYQWTTLAGAGGSSGELFGFPAKHLLKGRGILKTKGSLKRSTALYKPIHLGSLPNMEPGRSL